MLLNLESFSFPDSTSAALADITLDLEPGSCVLVAGGSGSGKSTLGLILAGVLPGQHRGTLRGSILVDGNRLDFPAAQAARLNHQHWNGLVGFAGQDAAAQLSTIASTVAEEIAFPLENAGMPRAMMQDRVRETATALGLVPLLKRNPEHLSGGQQKLVGIASAVARRPKFLILDEPLAGLDLEARSRVQAALHNLLAGGMGIVVLSQELGGTGPTPGQVVLLDGGRAVCSGSMEKAKEEACARRLPVLSGRDGGRGTGAGIPVAAEPLVGTAPGQVAHQTAAVAADALRFRYGWRKPRPWRRPLPARPVVDGVSLTLAPGNCLAIAGANGSGKSTLLRLLTGLSVPQEGSVRLLSGGAGGKAPDPHGTVLGALLQHPREQLFEQTVRREAGAGLPRSLGDAARRERVDRALDRCGLLDDADLHPYELPASRQRLTALAALLVQAPAFIALDEPTVSLDRPGLDLLAAAIAAEAARGAAIAMVTHDLDFASRVSHRLLVLSDGKAVAAGPFSDVLETHFASGTAYGVAAPGSWDR